MVIQTVGIVGTGVIGASWAALFLSRGLRVLVADPGPDAKTKFVAHVKSVWPSLEKIGVAKDATMDKYEFVGPSLLERINEVDFIQENAPERPDLKIKLIGDLDAATRPDVIIASSSSGIPSSQFIAQCKKNPGRVLIGHPFNPPHLMPLVEIVPHPGTHATCIKQAVEFYTSLNRRPIVVKQEVPGFVANRLQAALCNEAYGLVSRGIISANDLDSCVTTSLGPRWATVGPFMANAMGGGGGSDGFKHLLEHLGPASAAWLADMREHAYHYTPEANDILTASVAEELKGQDVQKLEAERDAKLIELLRSKKT